MSRYIDADALIKDIENDCPEVVYYTKRDAIDCIQAQPSSDVVAVVRCKDCVHWKDTSTDTVTETHWGECRKPLGDYRYCETAENDFCSYGERRENGTSI